MQGFWNLHRVKKLQSPSDHNKWMAPKKNVLKINVDGAFSDEGAGIGLVLRNHLGQIEAAMSERISGAYSADHVEALAFLNALQLAKDYGITVFLVPT